MIRSRPINISTIQIPYFGVGIASTIQYWNSFSKPSGRSVLELPILPRKMLDTHPAIADPTSLQMRLELWLAGVNVGTAVLSMSFFFLYVNALREVLGSGCQKGLAMGMNQGRRTLSPNPFPVSIPAGPA